LRDASISAAQRGLGSASATAIGPLGEKAQQQKYYHRPGNIIIVQVITRRAESLSSRGLSRRAALRAKVSSRGENAWHDQAVQQVLDRRRCVARSAPSVRILSQPSCTTVPVAQSRWAQAGPIQRLKGNAVAAELMLWRRAGSRNPVEVAQA